MDAAVINVEVVPGDGDSLRVRWETTEPVAVDISVGATPEAIDHEHARTEPAGTTEATLAGVPSAPTFVSVAPHGAGPAVVAGERRLRFAAMQNFRDLGGYRTADGRHTRWGRLFRADSLHKLTAEDRDAFDRLGLRVVVDLRGNRERARHPNPITYAMQIAVTGRPVTADEDEDESAARERERRDLAGADGERILRDLYIGMLEHSAGHFLQLYNALLAPDGLPAVFHCHAGKDRTGVVAALTLLALGVPASDVLDDYEMTRRFWHADNQRDSFDNLLSLGLSQEAAAGVLGAPRWAMEDTLHALETTYGGIERYLTGTVGLTPAQLDALRSALVV